MSITFPDAPVARPAPRPRGRGPLMTLLRPLASLQLTVALMGFSVGLVFFGTLAQKDAGIWTVIDQYFWSLYVLVDLNHLLDFVKLFFGDLLDAVFGLWGGKFTELKAHSWAKLPWPGGKLLGVLMFANLLVAQFTRLRMTWKKSGVYILHGGLLLLFAGEYITREFQVEQQMVIAEGQSAGYAFDSRSFELAVTDPSDPSNDKVTVVPLRMLRDALADGQVVRHPDLPFDLRVERYHANATLAPPAGSPNLATVGAGLARVAVEQPVVSGVEVGKKQDYPAVYATVLKKGTDEAVNTYLMSMRLDPQPVPLDGKTYRLELRFTHHYKPYEVHLVKFRFDRYPGTNTPKNYSSQVRVNDPERGAEFEATIAMNEPLRHRGETFYQQSFDAETEKSTVLQVVRNPGWLLPYLACGVVSLGLAVQFGITLVLYLRRMVSAERAMSRPLLPVVVLAVTGLLFVGMAWPKTPTSGKLDLTQVAGLPVQDGGRFKPLDSVARVDLRVINHKESFTDDKGATRDPIKWLMDAASADRDPGPAGKYPLFRVENDQVLSLLELKRREGLRYSFAEFGPRSAEFDAASRAASKKRQATEAGGPPLDLFENQLLEVRRHLELYLEVWQGAAPRGLLPPVTDGGKWRSYLEVRQEQADAVRSAVTTKLLAQGIPANFQGLNAEQKQRVLAVFEAAQAEQAARDPAYAGWTAVLDAYRANDPARFDAAVAEFKAIGEAALVTDPGQRSWMDRQLGMDNRDRVRLEQSLNRTALFYYCIPMYGLAVILGLACWVSLLLHPPAFQYLRRTAFWLMVGTLLVHGATLLARMYLLDRPLVFITNLYSTAVFIGFGAAVLGLLVERVLPLGLGVVVGSVLGFATCILAHNLATTGDTLDVLQAVLDTNFWLATHVTTINLGYAASYLAGAVGLVYLVMAALPHRAILGRTVTVGAGASARTLGLGTVVGQVLYGVVCLALLLSFVGTVLGGIWGDQSWGRFWGWDPKENGALLIVLWNALILHARWCGLVKDRGTAILALAGNCIVTWSYFGTNQLGIGLHAYGFNKELVTLCQRLWLSHAALVVLALIPWQAVWGPDGSVRSPKS